MHQFDEHHPELEGFSVHYHDIIRPKLLDKDEAREKALLRTILICVIFCCIAVGTSVILFKTADVESLKTELLFDIIVIALIAVPGTIIFGLSGIQSFTKDKIVGGVCDYIGWNFSESLSRPPDLDLWADLKLLPFGYDYDHLWRIKNAIFQNRLSGHSRGVKFHSVEVKLEKELNGLTKTVFHGRLFAISVGRRFLGRTIVLRDKKVFQRAKINGMKRVGLVDPIFERIFEVYSTDQVEARYLLTPNFMQALVDLETAFDGQKIRFAFDEGHLFIVVETGPQFKAGSMLKSLNHPARTQKILDEIGAIYDVIDGVMDRRR